MPKNAAIIAIGWASPVAATTIVIGAAASATKTIPVGAKGNLLPNYAPLVIAEQFGTLATLYLRRVRLGLSRALGKDGMTAHALQKYMEANDNFPQNVVAL